LRQLGKNPRNTGYLHWVKERIAKAGIDISHFNYDVNRNKGLVYATNEMFAKDSRVPRERVRATVIKKNLIPYKCAECGFSGKWRGKDVALHLDHINGIANDHRLENLRFLCPMCHAATETYCGKNVRERRMREKPKYHCIVCGVELKRNGKYCASCYQKSLSKTSDLDQEQVTSLIADVGMEQAAQQLGMNVSTLRRWRDRNHISIPDTNCGKNVSEKPEKEKPKPRHVYQLPKVSQKPSKHKYYCERCGKELKTHSRYCAECWHILDRKVERPDAITLAKMLLDTNFLQVGKSYGVSDNAVRKWCKQYDMPTKKPELKEWLTQHQSDS